MILYFFRRWFSLHHKPAVRVGTALLIALLLNLLFGAAFYFAESEKQPGLGFWDSVWWSMVTMTTVGYGDYFPKTFVGRFLVAYPCLVIGIGLIGYSLGVIAESMLEGFNQSRKGRSTMRFENHLVICQCPSISRVLQMVAQFRAAQGDPHRPAVVVTSRLDELPVEFREHSIHFIKGHTTSEESLTRAGVANAMGVIVLAQDPNDEGSDAESFTTGTLVKLIEEDAGRPISLVIELADRKNQRMMERVGANGIVPVEGITDMLLMQEMFNPGLRHLFEHLVTYKNGCELYLVTHRLAGRKLQEIQVAALENPTSIQIVGIIRNGVTMMNCAKSFSLEESDQLILIAEKRADYDAFESNYRTLNLQPHTA
ncbi:MAG: ion channel [Akkermansiaceae bacterium]|jgi:voltage-gated potassium channel|nr:ion channel [Akkermansiaceae bacterium]